MSAQVNETNARVTVDETVQSLTVVDSAPRVVVSGSGTDVAVSAPGPQGIQGIQGVQGPQGPSGVISVTAPITNSGTSTSANIGVTVGTTAASVASGDRGLPTGGTTGQALVKTSATDYDTAWSTLALGKVLQVVQTSKDDVFSTTSTTFTDITGFSVTITPSSTSSRVILIASFGIVGTGNGSAYWNVFNFVRNSTNIGQPSSGTDPGTFYYGSANNFASVAQNRLLVDSPSTTSAITYKVQVKTQTGGTVFVNRSVGSVQQRTSSQLIAIEVGP